MSDMSHTRRGPSRLLGLFLLITAFGVAALFGASIARADGSDPFAPTFTSSAPSIQSDKADYAPGELVTLNGANWQAGENVHIVVDDADGQTWTHVTDIPAAADGT